jgi:NTP pyrophosphatase (non-canonical NTP hydrolase)
MLKKKVLVWAKDKGILDNATPMSQFIKTLEEVSELGTAINANDRDEIIDAIGDIAVTLIIQAELNGLDFDQCLESAYNVIAKRKGTMINGTFVKES